MIVRFKNILCAILLCGTCAATSVARATVTQPLEIIDRPRTLPGGTLELAGGVDLRRTSYTDGTGDHAQSYLSAPLGLGYGISNDFDIRIFYGVGLHPTFTGKTPVDIRLAYTFFRDAHVSAAAQVKSGIDLGNNDVRPLVIGINAQYRVTSTFALFTPGEQLSVGLAGGDHPIGLDLPVGVGLQFTPQVFGSLTTNLAHIGIANEGNAFILADMLPVDVAAFYSFSNRADVGAHLAVDLKNTNNILFGVLGRLFL